MKEVIAVFDIGKTNKKCFLFDKKFQVVYQDYQQFGELVDEDGFPCDDLEAIKSWLFNNLDKLAQSDEYLVKGINFSSYGASFVHIDRFGTVLTPLYNYLKPLPDFIKEKFYNLYGPETSFAIETASPPSDMLNSGMQLYWLRHTQPEVFHRIRYSLHLPQYLSYLITGIPVSEPTSIGCHTALWDYKRANYHHWVYDEGIDYHLPFSIPTATRITTQWNGRRIRVGVGIHDSSSALLPYLLSHKKPFLLVSTGTWSVTLNPFASDTFTQSDLDQNCLFYQTIQGNPVRASKLFLGHEHKKQVEYLSRAFDQEYGAHRNQGFDEDRHKRVAAIKDNCFHLRFSGTGDFREPNLSELQSFADAYHRLVLELADYQEKSIKLAMGGTRVKKIFIDGGFADNEIYTTLIDRAFPKIKVRITKSPLGSALGAALLMRNRKIGSKFLKVHYGLKKIARKLKKST